MNATQKSHRLSLVQVLFLPENYCKFGNENSTMIWMMRLCIENGEISIAIFAFGSPSKSNKWTYNPYRWHCKMGQLVLFYPYK